MRVDATERILSAELGKNVIFSAFHERTPIETANDRPCFLSVDAAVEALRPSEPLYCSMPSELKKNADQFLKHFPGKAYYAVKANSDPEALTHLYNAGIHHFDVASLGEVKLVRRLFPDARLAYMHPVKGREAIKASYFDYGVRVFVLDSFDELKKIQEETRGATDVTLIVRLTMPKGSAAVPLTGKFGAAPDLCVALMRKVYSLYGKVGLSFHVGSQSLDPESYVEALRRAGDVIKESGVAVSVFDVGGGFPIRGIGTEIKPLTDYFDVVRRELAALKLPSTCDVWCEPGGALSGTSASVVVRVELRKDNNLYINDGNFGHLRDLCYEERLNDVRRIRLGQKSDPSVALKEFHFFGPTCESMDYMPGPFLLPEDINEGDYIEVSSLGAYGLAFRTQYNGFYSDLRAEIAEPSKEI